MDNSRSILGVILVIIGGLFLLDTFRIFHFDFGYIFFNWGTLFFVIGILILSKTKNSIAGWIFLFIGGIVLSGRIFDFSARSFISDFWPLILIGIGLYILLNRRSSGNGSGAESASSNQDTSQFSTDTIDESSIFYSSKKIITSDSFRGGKITSIFGECELDLTNSKLAEGPQVIDVLALFGGLKLFVRQDLKLDVKVTSIFGGFSDKRIKSPNVVPDQSRTLVLKGIVLFGGGTIQNYA